MPKKSIITSRAAINSPLSFWGIPVVVIPASSKEEREMPFSADEDNIFKY